MTNTRNTTGGHFVEHGGTGYGWSVLHSDAFDGGGPIGRWSVVSGPYTTREQAQAEADRRNQVTT